MRTVQYILNSIEYDSYNNALKFSQNYGRVEREVRIGLFQEATETLLIQVPGLNKLKFGDVTEVDFYFLSELADLTELDLSNQGLDAWQVEQLSSVLMPKLKGALARNVAVLKLGGSNISGGDVKKIANFKYLKELDLGKSGID